MNDDLIDRLVGDLRPTPRRAAAGRIGIGLGAGAVLSAVLMVIWLGLRPDLASALATGPYWMKFAYTLGLAAVALVAAARLSRPAGKSGRVFPALVGIVALLGALALLQLAIAAPGARMPLVLGKTYDICPYNIVVLSLPILAGVLWALRGLAPTRLALAGAAAGLTAGAAGAWIYSFHCDESAAPFIAIWYTAGIAAVTLVGALTGRWLLRW